MPLIFPSSPSVGDIYTTANGSWRWDGVSWNGFSPLIVETASSIPTFSVTDAGRFIRLSTTGDVYYNNGTAWFPLQLETSMLTKRVDFADPYVYVGTAAPGAVNSAAVWSIKRIEFTGVDGDVVELWADGDAQFNNIWDNRTSLTYS